MTTLSDELLLETYNQAVKLNLSIDFRELLVQEIRSRGLVI